MIVQKRALVAAALASLTSIPALAVSLGEAKVRSYLGQPLLVQVALPGTSYAEGSNLRARIGEPEDFERLSLQYEHGIASLRVRPVERDGNWVIEISSNAPFKQPILEFPLKVFAGENRLLRAYTLLLDPPSYQLQQASVPVRRSRPEEAPAPSSPPAMASYSPYTYEVQSGDTLWPIAAAVKPANSNTARMMRAILEANPEAFIDGDVNRLLSGSTLRIPNVAWGEVGPYERQKGGTPPTTRKEIRLRAGGTAAEQKPLPTVPDITVAESDIDQPRIAVVGNDASQNTSPKEYLEQQVYLTQEEFEKNRLEQQEIREQLAKLTQELAQLQRLMLLKDQQIEALQSVVASQQQALEVSESITAERIAADIKPTETAAEVSPRAAVELKKPAIATEGSQRRTDFPWWIAIVLIIALPLLGWVIWTRRSQAEGKNAVLAELPEISNAPPAPYSEEVNAHTQKTRDVGDTSEVQAESTRNRKEESLQVSRDRPEAISEVDESMTELNDALPELDEFQASVQGSLDLDKETEYEQISDDELAELAEQLNRELESDYPEPIPGNVAQDFGGDDLGRSPGSTVGDTGDLPTLDLQEGLEYDEVDESLDLARAYLVVGDNAAAIAILEQALESATEPEKRRRIEELMAEAV